MKTTIQQLIQSKLEEINFYYENGQQYEFNQSNFELAGHIHNFMEGRK